MGHSAVLIECVYCLLLVCDGTISGVGVSERDAAVARADSDISPLCGVYYFEVTIVSRGRDG